MPVVPDSAYEPPCVLRNPYVQFPATLLRKVPSVSWETVEFDVDDGDDFLEIDRLPSLRDPGKRLAIIAPGLEGTSDSRHTAMMAQALAASRWDVSVWNYRGARKANRTKRAYHAGDSTDLASVIEEEGRNYDRVVLVGFSIGGNIVLKHLGELGAGAPDKLVAAVAISAPCDLGASVAQWSDNAILRLYGKASIRRMQKIARRKHFETPDLVTAADVEGYDLVGTVAEADFFINGKANDFRDGADYWAKAASLGRLDDIKVSTLMLSARDDPLLSPGCYPESIADNHDYLWLEATRYGGHVGFVDRCGDGLYFSERRTLTFIKEHAAE